jgi:WD40 repeat protein
VYKNTSTRATTFGSLDVETGAFQEVTSHGKSVWTAAFDPTGTTVVTGDANGVVRVGPLDGGEPHLLYGHTLEVSSVEVSPDGKRTPPEARTERSGSGRCPRERPSTPSPTRRS